MILRLALAASLACVTTAGAGEAPPPVPVERPAPAEEPATAVRVRVVGREALAADPAPLPHAPHAPRAGRVPRAPRIPMSVPAPGEEAHTDTLFPVRPPARLELDNFGGQIVVIGWDRNAVRVQATHGHDTHVDFDLTPAVISIEATRTVAVRPTRRDLKSLELPAQVDYRLTVPRWMGLRLSGVQTEMVVEGVQAEVSAEAVSGPISVRGGRGSVRVSAINGDVEVSGARGVIEASSMSGGVTIHDVEGRIRVESVNGDVDLARIVSDAVDASTVTGDLRYESALRPGGSYRLSSHSGNVVVALPQRADVAASINTWSGDFQSSFPLRVNTVRPRREFDFTLGNGSAELDLQSFSGAIRLVRAGDVVRGQVQRLKEKLHERHKELGKGQEGR